MYKILSPPITKVINNKNLAKGLRDITKLSTFCAVAVLRIAFLKVIIFALEVKIFAFNKLIALLNINIPLKNFITPLTTKLAAYPTPLKTKLNPINPATTPPITLAKVL